MARIEKRLGNLILFFGLALVLLVSSCPTDNPSTDVDVTAPEVPTGLVVTAVSSSQINLVWNSSKDDVGVTGYKIFRGGVYLKTVASGTSTSDTGLSASTQYCYCVSAYDAANNESARCTQQCATTHSQSPTTQYTLTVTSSPSNGGTVTKSPDQTKYDSGTIVTLTANPVSGFLFTRWEGGLTGTANPTMVTMNGNKTVTAVFTASSTPLIQLSTSSLTFSATSGGSAPAGKTVTITNGGSGTLSGLSRSFPDGTPIWLGATLSGTTAPATLTVSISITDPFGNPFGAGTLTTRIAINSASASNSPQYINANLTLLAPSSISAYASYDNGVMNCTDDSSPAEAVYSNSTLGVGFEYRWTSLGYEYCTAGSAIKFNVQSQISGRSVSKATLRLYPYALRGDFSITPQIRVNAFSNDWDPSTLNWNTWLPMAYHTTGEARVNAPSSSLPLDIDVTTIVQNWASGTWGNYGFKLYPLNHSYPGYSSLQATYFQSLEYYYQTNQRPQLIVEFQ